jgi:hypothetical protein
MRASDIDFGSVFTSIVCENNLLIELFDAVADNASDSRAAAEVPYVDVIKRFSETVVNVEGTPIRR